MYLQPERRAQVFSSVPSSSSSLTLKLPCSPRNRMKCVQYIMTSCICSFPPDTSDSSQHVLSYSIFIWNHECITNSSKLACAAKWTQDPSGTLSLTDCCYWPTTEANQPPFSKSIMTCWHAEEALGLFFHWAVAQAPVITWGGGEVTFKNIHLEWDLNNSHLAGRWPC